MGCPQRDGYVTGAATEQGLETLTEKIFKDIKSSFKCNVKFGIQKISLGNTIQEFCTCSPNATQTLLIKNPGGLGRFIEGCKRVYILNHNEWLANKQLTEGNRLIIGRYLYDLGVILLQDNRNYDDLSWCINILTHELLHSTSLYSRIWYQSNGLLNRTNIIFNHMHLNEGITEFLTGYVLFKKRHECYLSWRKSLKGKCEILYKPQTKLFCSLSQVVGITPIAEFYFSTANNFTAAWTKFIQDIKSAGFNTFNFPLDENTVFREYKFRDKCIKSIEGFEEIYESKVKSLDFSNIS